MPRTRRRLRPPDRRPWYRRTHPTVRHHRRHPTAPAARRHRAREPAGRGRTAPPVRPPPCRRHRPPSASAARMRRPTVHGPRPARARAAAIRPRAARSRCVGRAASSVPRRGWIRRPAAPRGVRPRSGCSPPPVRPPRPRRRRCVRCAPSACGGVRSTIPDVSGVRRPPARCHAAAPPAGSGIRPCGSPPSRRSGPKPPARAPRSGSVPVPVRGRSDRRSRHARRWRSAPRPRPGSDRPV